MANEFERLVGRTMANTRPWSLAGWQGHAKVVDVFDGDTLKAILEYVPGHFAIFSIRILGINTCEMRSHDPEEKKKAYAARDFAISWCMRRAAKGASHESLESSKQEKTREPTRADIQADFSRCNCIVWLHVTGLDKYGRLLAHVRPATSCASNPDADLAHDILRAGLASPYPDPADPGPTPARPRA
jgi:endonuclease YncB( thermonuclease family)